MSCRCVLPIAAGLAEGPCWWSERNILLWVDIEASRIGLFDPATGNNDFFHLPAHVGAVVPTSVGDLLLATAAGLMRMDPRTGVVTLLLDPEVDRPGNRFNDGKCDPWGRFWAGTMSYDFEPMAGSLWRLDGDGRITRQRSQLTISNGLAWSQDRVQIPEDWDAVPDGMCIDAEGMLWIALFGGGAVTRWDPISGQLLERLAVPCRQVTSCCFGGPHLDQLFITTARREMDAAAIAAEPLAGGLFQADVGVKGLPADPFQVAA
jgi:sugar lactone lactonase YvrE